MRMWRRGSHRVQEWDRGRRSHKQSNHRRETRKRDADSGMIINNALRNQNQNIWQQWKGQTRLWALYVASERTSQHCLFQCYLRQQDLINSGQICLFLPTGRNRIKSCKLQLKLIPGSKDGAQAKSAVPSPTVVLPHNSLLPFSFPLSRFIIILYLQGVKKRINRHRLANCEEEEEDVWTAAFLLCDNITLLH